MPILYDINPDCFEQIDNEGKAYCAGFFLADAWVQSQDKGVSFAIQARDVPLIDYVRFVTGSTAPTLIKRKSSGYGSRDLLTVNLSRKKIASDLAKVGIVRGKSKNARIPVLPDNILRHFMRGLFDGDGCINHRQMWLIASEPLLTDTAALVARFDGKTSIGLSNGYPRLSGGRTCGAFLHWMYDNCEFALPRKLQKIRDHW